MNKNQKSMIRFYAKHGLTVLEVRKKYRWVKFSHLKNAHRESILEKTVGVCLGSKNESYFTEEEMLNGYTAPSIDEVLKEFQKSK